MTSKRQQAAQEQRRSVIERHVGRTPEERLRWVIEEFLRADLKTELPETLAAYGVYIKIFAPQPSKPGELVMANLGPTEGLSVDQVKRIHRRFGDALTTVRQHGEWPDVPKPTRVMLTAHGSRANWVYEYDLPEDGILVGLCEAAVAGWAYLRNCPECQRLFVRHHKQEYCSVQCSMKRRNRARPRPRQRRRLTTKGT